MKRAKTDKRKLNNYGFSLVSDKYKISFCIPYVTAPTGFTESHKPSVLQTGNEICI